MYLWCQGPNVPMLSLRVARGPLCVSPIGPLPTLESFHTVLSRATYYKSFPLGRIYISGAPSVKTWMVAHCICVIVNNLWRWEIERGSTMLPSSKISHTMNDANFLPPLPSSSYPSRVFSEAFNRVPFQPKRTKAVFPNGSGGNNCQLVDLWIYIGRGGLLPQSFPWTIQ